MTYAIVEVSLVVMSQIESITLDRLPSPPRATLKIDAPLSRGGATNLVERGLRFAQAGEDLLGQLERHNSKLKVALNGLCSRVEEVECTSEELSVLIKALLDREKNRAKEFAPALEMIKKNRSIGAKLKKPLHRRFFQICEDIFDRIEDAVATELEAYRDARLKLEISRADLINEHAADGPIFNSGKATAASLRALRK